MIVPVFPLRGVFLYPGAVLPLHIFEPRYRTMVEDLLDTAGRLVIAATRDGAEPGIEGAPPIHPVAGLGEISGHERLPDGRFLIALYGLDRVTIEEVASDRPYRLVKTNPLVEEPIDPDLKDEYRSRLESALKSSGGDDIEIPPEFPTERMIDVVMMQSRAEPEELARVYGLNDLAARAEAALTLPRPTGPIEED